MRSLCLLLAAFVASALFADRPNILLICIDDLRPELASFGADYIHSPNIDRLANEGRPFSRHYVQAPTCGASRYTLLTGMYGRGGNSAILSRGKKLLEAPERFPPSLPAHFREHGYTTVSVGKVSHHPGGMAGKDWADPAMLEMPFSWDRALMPSGPWLHPKGAMHGLANGEIRKKAGEMDVIQAVEGDDNTYPDGLITDTALRELEQLSKADEPFFLAVGFIRPHLPFGAPKKYLDLYADVDLPPIPFSERPKGKTTWHRSGEFFKYKRWGKDPNKNPEFADAVRRHYAACVSYVDAQVGRVLEKLEKLGEMENTLIVLWGDHGWHLGEHQIWGKHALFEESLRSPLIIRASGMAQAGEMSDSIVETVDIYPTLCELVGLPIPEALSGDSLKTVVLENQSISKEAIAYHGGAQTIRTDRHRLITHKKGARELYDHQSPEKETRNIASENPELVKALEAKLKEQLGN